MYIKKALCVCIENDDFEVIFFFISFYFILETAQQRVMLFEKNGGCVGMVGRRGGERRGGG